MLGSLITRPWFTEGANVWQWATSIVALAGWSLAAHLYWTSRCHVCHWRHGHHPVKGTTWKVCHRHHLPEHHVRLAAEHRRKHPDRLGYGESPTGRKPTARA